MAKQVLRQDDTFNEGNPVYGDFLQRYIGIQPWSVNPDIWTGYSLKVGWGHIFDGRSGLAAPGRAAAFTNQASVPDGDRINWVVDRSSPHFEFGEVYFHPQLKMLTGSFDNDTVRGCGVGARITDGVLTTPSGGNHSDDYYTDVSGIFFVHAKQASLTHRLFLLSIDNGVVTRLQQEDVGNLPGGQVRGAQNDAAENPQPMRMVLEDAGGGNVRIYCYRRRFIQETGAGLFGSSGGSGAITEDLVFSPFLMTSPPSSSGRCGFGMQLAKSQSAGDSTMICKQFRITLGSNLFLRDRFRRSIPEASRQLSDPLGTIGYSLASSFTGDSQGDSLSTFKHFGHLKRDAGANQLRIGSTPPAGSSQVHGWYMSQRPASSATQHRSMIFTLTNIGSEVVRCGIHLRGIWYPQNFVDMRARESVGGAFRDYRKEGYLALVKYDNSDIPTWTLEIRAHTRGGSTSLSYRSALLATADLTSAGLATNTPFTFDFEVQNFDGDAFGSGQWPAMRVKINGLVIEPTLESDLVGVVQNDSWVIDGRSDSCNSGLAEGFYIDVDQVNPSELVEADYWRVENPSSPPEVEELDEVSVALRAETYGKTGTLTTPLSWPVELQPGGFEPIRHRFETGHLQTFPRSRRSRRIWVVQLQGGTRAEREDLQNFFRAHKGVEIPFDWVRPSVGELATETVCVRCLNDTLEHVMDWARGDGVESFELILGEVFDHENFNQTI